MPEEFDTRLRGDVAGAHRYRLDAARPASLRHVDSIFEEDHRIVIGKRDRAAAAAQRGFGNGLRGGLILNAVERARFGDVPVLAELAGQVAAGGAERKHRRAWQKMVERLLLDRIDAKAGGAPVGRKQNLIVLPRAHEAQAALPLMQLAIARAYVALDTAILQPGTPSMVD